MASESERGMDVGGVEVETPPHFTTKGLTPHRKCRLVFRSLQGGKIKEVVALFEGESSSRVTMWSTADGMIFVPATCVMELWTADDSGLTRVHELRQETRLF